MHNGFKKVSLVAALALALGAVVLWHDGQGGAEAESGKVSSSMIQTAVPALARSATTGNLLEGLPTNQMPTVRGTLPYVVKSEKPFVKSLRLAVEAMGARTVCSLSRNSFLVEATPSVRSRLASDGRFEEISEILPSAKLQPELVELVNGGAKSVDVSLVALAAEDRAMVISCLEQGGGEMLKGCINEGDTIRARLPSDLVASLAVRGDVRWMEKFVRPQLSNDQAIQPAAMNVTNVWDMSRGLGLSGLGQKISTSDSGIDTGSTNTMHRDLANHVKAIHIVKGCDAADYNGHGTHTAGSIVGDGTCCDGKYRGTAYEAELYAWFCGAGGGRSIYTPDKAADLFRPDDVDAYIHSASWGASESGKYTTLCADYDKYAWENPEFLPVFSAGNEGSSARTIGSPGASKNVLTVGATVSLPGNPASTASFSSRGPCQDGRTKPDVAAPGNPVTSTRSSLDGGNVKDGYTSMSGTSMSCPLTAGAVALTRQWLLEKMGFADEDGERPTAALMKAVVMGGAKGAEVPNNNQGWGRVDLADTLAPTNGCAVKLIDRIPFAEGFETNIVVEVTNAAPLDVQLVWVDYPGSASGSQSMPKLVNDIDLLVEARPEGAPEVYCYGNGGDSPDTLNNAESVRISMASPSKYVITINCKTILHDYTEGGAAALYIRGAFDPDAEVEAPEYVRLKKLGRGFRSLDRALKAVCEDGETVEILDWVNLSSHITLTNSCTIVATNENAAASFIARADASMLSVTNNATLTLTNVSFSASAAKLVQVEAGGKLEVGGLVDFGIADDAVAVSTADDTGFVLAAPLMNSMVIETSAASTNDQFGTYTCDIGTATNNAIRIANAIDYDRELRGEAFEGRLVWRVHMVPMEDASGYFVDDASMTNTYARIDRTFRMFEGAMHGGLLPANPTLWLRKSGPLSRTMVITNAFSICGETGDIELSLTNTTATTDVPVFEILEGGALAVSNVKFTGFNLPHLYEGVEFISVNGGSLELGGGAVLDDITGKVSYGSGVIDVWSGAFTMKSGAVIVNCTAEGGNDGNGSGGAAYAYAADDVTLNFLGGTISNCFAQSFGGGVFVEYIGEGYGHDEECPAVNLAGDSVIRDNASGESTADNLYFYNYGALAKFLLIGELTGSVGVKYALWGDGNEVGDEFVTVGGGLTPAAIEDSAECLVNDATTLANVVAKPNDGGDALVWASVVPDGTCEEAEGRAHVHHLSGDVKHYKDLATALEYMTNGTHATVVMASASRDYDSMRSDMTVPEGCVITLAGTNDAPYRFVRRDDVGLTVVSNATLAIRNIVFETATNMSESVVIDKPLIDVDGGALTLEAGTVITNIVGGRLDAKGNWQGARDAGAISVGKGGTVTMLDGAEIVDCGNRYWTDRFHDENPSDYAVGGAICVDDASTAYLRGGRISGSIARHGHVITTGVRYCCSGVYVGNYAKAYVSGGVEIDGMVIEDESSLTLDGPLTGCVRLVDGVNCDTNYIGAVDGDWWKGDYIALTNSAARFEHYNERGLTNAYGVAQTNSLGNAWMEWRYFTPVEPEPEPEPEPEDPLPVLPENPTAQDVEQALDDADMADDRAREEILAADDPVKAYNDFKQWSDNIYPDGEESVVASTNAWVSYEFGCTNLFENAPTVEFTQVRVDNGATTQVKLTVVVKDGENAHDVASKKAGELFEASANLVNWDLGFTVKEDQTQDTGDVMDSTVEYLVTPGDGTSPMAFIRLKY